MHDSLPANSESDLAQAGEIKLGSDPLALRRIHRDARRIGRKSRGGKVEFKSRADQRASALFAATIICVAARRGKRHGLFAAMNLDLKIVPEITLPSPLYS